MIQPVSYSLCSLAFTLILCHSSRTRSLLLLNSPRLLLFTSSFLLKNVPYHALSDTSPHVDSHAYIPPIHAVKYLLASNILDQLALVFENRNSDGDYCIPFSLEEGEVRLWCAERLYSQLLEIWPRYYNRMMGSSLGVSVLLLPRTRYPRSRL